MTEQKSPAELLAEASSEDTRSFIRRMKRASRRKYTPEEKVRIVLEGCRGGIGISAVGWQDSVRIWGAHTVSRPCAWSRVQSTDPRAVASDPVGAKNLIRI